MTDLERTLELMHGARRFLPVHAILDVSITLPRHPGHFGQKLGRMEMEGGAGKENSYVDDLWYASPDRWRLESMRATGGEAFLHVQAERYRWYRRSPEDPRADGLHEKSGVGDAAERSHEVMWDPNMLIPELWMTATGRTIVAGRPGFVVAGVHRKVSHDMIVVPYWSSDAYEIVVDEETGMLLRLVARVEDGVVAREEVREIAFGIDLPDELFRLPPDEEGG